MTGMGLQRSESDFDSADRPGRVLPRQDRDFIFFGLPVVLKKYAHLDMPQQNYLMCIKISA